MANPVRVRTAAGWQDLAIMGATGAQGPTGATGAQGAQGPMGPSGSAVWMTGDTKIGMQALSHDDPGGGRWLLADGTAIPGTYTALIALIGATLPDARGRGLVMLGTHADVNAIGKSDGVGITARRPAHKHTTAVGTDSPDHSHNVYVEGGGNPITFRPGGGAGNGNVSLMGSLGANARHSHSVTVGPQVGLEPTDNPSYVVVGNLFVHT